MMTSRVGMYLNWNRSRRNTASTAHTHTQLPQLHVSSCSGHYKGTHDAEVRPCRAQHLSQSSSPATNQSLLQFNSKTASWKMSTSYSFFQCWPSSRTVHGRLSPPTVPKVLLAHISISNYFDLFACTKLLLSTNIITYYCFDEHHKYSSIITQYAQILLLSHNMLKYYYYHTICSNTTIIIVQRDKSTKIDVGARGGARGGQLYVRVRDFGEWALTFNLRK